MSTAYNSRVVTDGLVLCLDAANLKSYPRTGNTWVDLSGNGYNGSIINDVTYVENNCGSFDFNASNEKVEVPNISFGNNTTWCAWVNRTSSINTYNMFMGKGLPYFGLLVGSVIFSNTIDRIQRTLNSTGFTPSNNTWYYLVFTTEYDGVNTTSKIYINASFNNSASFSGFQSGYTTIFTLGDGRNTSPWYPFNGKISSVSIYNRTLSAEEIQQNFNALRERYNI